MVAVYVAGALRSLTGHHGTVAYDGHSPLNGGHLRLDDHRYTTMFHRALELMRSWRERPKRIFPGKYNVFDNLRFRRTDFPQRFLLRFRRCSPRVISWLNPNL